MGLSTIITMQWGEGRLIALDTSIDLSALQRAQAISPEVRKHGIKVCRKGNRFCRTELRVDGGSRAHSGGAPSA